MQELKLEETPNILKNTIKNKTAMQKIVSFALETENALQNAQKKFDEGGMDILVVNTADNFGMDRVEYGILSKNSQSTKLACGSKEELASQLFIKAND